MKFLMAVFFVLVAQHAQAGSAKSLVCAPTIIETTANGPVAVTIVSGSFSAQVSELIGQKVAVTSNAFLTQRNAPNEENPVTIENAVKMDGRGKIAVQASIDPSGNSTATTKTFWSVCTSRKSGGSL